MAKTKKQTGLTITRVSQKFLITWKIGDKNYGAGQTVKYRKKGAKKWTTVSGIGKKTTSVKIDAKGTTEVMMRGTRSAEGGTTYTASDWAKKTYTVQNPKTPTVEVALTEQANVCNFSWKVEEAGSSSKYWFTGVAWEAMLVEDNTVSDGAKLTWDSATAVDWRSGTSNSAESNQEITENTSTINSGNYTRWFRIKSVGKVGDSKWKYARHVYADPKQANISSATGEKNEAGGTNVTIRWAAETSEAQPIDDVIVQYLIIAPSAGLTCPAGASGWTDIVTLRDTENTDSISVSIDDQADENTCMFVRVNTKNETEVTEGVPILVADGGIGYLSTPESLSVNIIDQSAHVVTVSATNKAKDDVEDSFLVVRFTSDNEPGGFDIAIIPHNSNSAQITCPDWGSGNYSFSVYAAVGSYIETTRADGITGYAVAARMISSILKDGGNVPLAPARVLLSNTDKPGTIQVTWDWSWGAADSVELSWADHDDAWESTDIPSTFMIENTYVSKWNIAGLETGKVWYVKVRMCSNIEGGMTYGPYSETKSINLSSAPAVPDLTLSQSVVTNVGTFTASWGYSSTDGTKQAYAELDEVIINNNNVTYKEIAHVSTAQHVSVDVAELIAESDDWLPGTRHGLAVYVVSESGRRTGYSDIEYIDIANPVYAEIVETSIAQTTIMDPDDTQRTANVLTELPFTITVEGAGESGMTTVIVERADSYYLERADESDFNGHEGETIALVSQNGEGQITIPSEDIDLIGSLDDGASYRIIATVQDGIGQSASNEPPFEFEVHWDHQAIIPDGTAIIDNDNLIAILRPIAPTGTETGDTCDIYRLSVDKPQLIFEDAEWGVDYVDPYPTIGQYGGYRFVFKTVNGDFITDQNELAIFDVMTALPANGYNIIDFGSGRILLDRNIDLSNSWEKDFKETKYLGGSVQGDWNPAVSRNSSVSSCAVTLIDQNTIEAMRDLAMYSDICHVRTQDGSTYTADVQVSEDYSHDTGNMVAEFSLSITRVDPEELDGMTYSEWVQIHQVEGGS